MAGQKSKSAKNKYVDVSAAHPQPNDAVDTTSAAVSYADEVSSMRETRSTTRSTASKSISIHPVAAAASKSQSSTAGKENQCIVANQGADGLNLNVVDSETIAAEHSMWLSKIEEKAFDRNLLDHFGRALVSLFELTLDDRGYVNVLEFCRRAFGWTDNQWKHKKHAITTKASKYVNNVLTGSGVMTIQPLGVLYFAVEKAGKTELLLYCSLPRTDVRPFQNEAISSGSVENHVPSHFSLSQSLYCGTGWINQVMPRDGNISELRSKLNFLCLNTGFNMISLESANLELTMFQKCDLPDHLVLEVQVLLVAACGPGVPQQVVDDVCSIAVLASRYLGRGSINKNLLKLVIALRKFLSSQRVLQMVCSLFEKLFGRTETNIEGNFESVAIAVRKYARNNAWDSTFDSFCKLDGVIGKCDEGSAAASNDWLCEIFSEFFFSACWRIDVDFDSLFGLWTYCLQAQNPKSLMYGFVLSLAVKGIPFSFV